MVVVLNDADFGGDIYTLCDGREGGYDWHELAAAVEQVWQRRVRLWSVPRGLLNLVAATNLRLAQCFGYAPMLTPAKLRELRHPNWVVSNEEIQSVYQWQPTIGLDKGLTEIRETVL